MPTRPVTVRRWEVVLAFLLLAAVAVGGDIRSDRRIDAAEQRIRMNTVTNESQDAVRAELGAGLREADRRACALINDLRAENRREAQRQFDDTERNLRLIGVASTPEIREIVESELARALKQNKEAEC